MDEDFESDHRLDGVKALIYAVVHAVALSLGLLMLAVDIVLLILIVRYAYWP